MVRDFHLSDDDVVLHDIVASVMQEDARPRAADDDIADYVKELVPDAEITFLSLERSQSHLIMACKYDMSRIQEELGFRTQWTMKQGVKETINLVRQEKGLKPV